MNVYPLLAMAQFPSGQVGSIEGVACCPIRMFVARCCAKGDQGPLSLIIDVKRFNVLILSSYFYFRATKI